MRRIIVLTVTAVIIFTLSGAAFAANYVKQDEFRTWMNENRKMIIIDIQPAADFEKHHFKGSHETNAFPAKTDEEKKKLAPVLGKILSSADSVVIVCPRGKSGAANTYEYLKQKGVPEDRLFILEGGIAGWPHKEIFEKGR